MHLRPTTQRSAWERWSWKEGSSCCPLIFRSSCTPLSVVRYFRGSLRGFLLQGRISEIEYLLCVCGLPVLLYLFYHLCIVWGFYELELLFRFRLVMLSLLNFLDLLLNLALIKLDSILVFIITEVGEVGSWEESSGGVDYLWNILYEHIIKSYLNETITNWTATQNQRINQGSI